MARLLSQATAVSYHLQAMSTVNPKTEDPVERIVFAALWLLAGGAVHTAVCQYGLASALVLSQYAFFGLFCYLLWQIATGIQRSRRITAATRHLPGPDLGILGVIKLFVIRQDTHRALTELADQFGPIFRLQALFFRVHRLVVRTSQLPLRCRLRPAEDLVRYCSLWSSQILSWQCSACGCLATDWTNLELSILSLKG